MGKITLIDDKTKKFMVRLLNKSGNVNINIQIREEVYM